MRIAYLTVPTTSSKVRKSIFPYLLWHLETAEPGRGKLWWIWKQWNPKATFSFSTLGTTLASPWSGAHKCAQNPGRPLFIWKWCPFYNPKCTRSALNSHRLNSHSPLRSSFPCAQPSDWRDSGFNQNETRSARSPHRQEGWTQTLDYRKMTREKIPRLANHGAWKLARDPPISFPKPPLVALLRVPPWKPVDISLE